jgi:hypothetical protein
MSGNFGVDRSIPRDRGVHQTIGSRPTMAPGPGAPDAGTTGPPDMPREAVGKGDRGQSA